MTIGPSISGAPWIKLALDVSSDEIGEAVLEALNNSKSDRSLPDFSGEEGKKYIDERYEAAGVKSEMEYMQDSKYVFVSLEGDLISFTPSKNNGTKGSQKGYDPLADQKSEINETNNFSEIGKALAKAWDKCI